MRKTYSENARRHGMLNSPIIGSFEEFDYDYIQPSAKVLDEM